VLAELHAARDQIEEVIVAFERLVRLRSGKRLGRPPKTIQLVDPKGPRLVVRKHTKGSSIGDFGEIPKTPRQVECLDAPKHEPRPD